jgi:tetratricopeptide (TPR) repeat protein
METKDYYTIIISVIALIVSIFSNFFQKTKEDKRAIRKNLSDTLESVTKINIENTKLRQNNIEITPENIELRRNYNTQRRILIAHADYLISTYDKIVTEIDCNIVAIAYSNIGDPNRAEFYWKKTIEKSVSLPIKHMNLRGYASFLFNQGKMESGRNKYREALMIDLPDTDNNRDMISDTYLMWAKSEKSYNNENEANKLIEDASSFCSRIGNKGIRAQRQKQIEHMTNKKEIDDKTTSQ